MELYHQHVFLISEPAGAKIQAWIHKYRFSLFRGGGERKGSFRRTISMLFSQVHVPFTGRPDTIFRGIRPVFSSSVVVGVSGAMASFNPARHHIYYITRFIPRSNHTQMRDPGPLSVFTTQWVYCIFASWREIH